MNNLKKTVGQKMMRTAHKDIFEKCKYLISFLIRDGDK